MSDKKPDKLKRLLTRCRELDKAHARFGATRPCDPYGEEERLKAECGMFTALRNLERSLHTFDAEGGP